MDNATNNRLRRTHLLFGDAGMSNLRRANVLVVGLGAVGSYCVEALVRSGIGTISLVDSDSIEVTNINRQLYALNSTLGMRKVDAAAARVADIAPDCSVRAHQIFVGPENVSDLLPGSFNVVVDAIDTLNAKVSLCEAAVRAGIPVVSAMGAARRLDPTRVRVGELAETRGCPLARFVRKRLRRRGIEAGIRCVFSDEPVSKASLGAMAPAQYREGRERHELGSYSCVTGVFGLVAASEVIRNVVQGKWLRSSVEVD